jgi:hypothetical protein
MTTLVQAPRADEPEPPSADDAHRIAVRAWLDETEAFAQEIARHSVTSASSVELVREQRREL